MKKVDVKSQYCACGAQWHGQSVIDGAENIQAHHNKSFYSDGHKRCRRMSHVVFIHTHLCYCPECKAERRAKWKVAHGRSLTPSVE